MNSNFLVIKNLIYSGANALAGVTYGFPSIGAILGFIEKLNLEIGKCTQRPFSLSSVVILSHDTNCRVYRESSNSDFSFVQKRAPLAKDGKTAPIIQEGYIDGDVSLVIALEDIQIFYEEDFNYIKDEILSILMRLKFAGGCIDSISDLMLVSNDNLKTTIKNLYPFAALVNRSDYFTDMVHQNSDIKILDCFLSLSSIHHRFNKTLNIWQQLYSKDGFLVPLHVGYKQISEDFENSDSVNLRSSDAKACFVEPIFSAGEWLCSYQKLLDLLERDYEKASWKYFHTGSYFLFSSSIL